MSKKEERSTEEEVLQEEGKEKERKCKEDHYRKKGRHIT